ncbi:MAG: DUF5979 domain-containing protein [Caldicoprobacterales bacterium]|jgi:uncharacterized repeat protein (TIGR01451 family)
MIKNYGIGRKFYKVFVCLLSILLLNVLILPIHNTVGAAEDSPVAEPEEFFSILSDGIEVLNYFEAYGTSTNDHYTVVGVYIAANEEIHLILDNDKNTANQTRFYNPMLNGQEAAGYGLSFTNYEPYWYEAGTTISLSFPDSTTKEVTGVRLFDFNLGQMMSYLNEENTLQMLNQADGFSIRGMTFYLNLGHTITKEVNKPLATIGDELIYTVVVENTGELTLSGINVYDDQPEGISVTGVSEDMETWNDPVLTDGVALVAAGLTLLPGESKTYYIKATVTEDANDGDVIINTAFTGGNVPRKEADAEVKIEVKVKVTIKKVITGNFGDLGRKFSFSVTSDKGNHSYNFELGNNQTKVLENLPAGAVLTLTEESAGYSVTVMAAGNEIEANEENEYLLPLGKNDVTVTVTNHSNIDINTGINLDSLPYIIILALVIIGIAVLLIRRYGIRSED